MKKLQWGLTLAVVLAFALPGHVFAQEQPVEYYRYVLMNDLPIPERSIVEFVNSTYGLAMKWEQQLGFGFKIHTVYLESVELSMWDTEPNEGFSTTRTPYEGERATLYAYYDWEDARGDYGEDGVVDTIGLQEYREWTDEEVTLVETAQAFEDDAVESDYALVYHNADCVPSRWWIDGAPAQPGPYGSTYKVQQSGSWLQGDYAGTWCMQSGYVSRFGAKTFVKPGDIFRDVDSVSRIGDEGTGICGILEWIRPAYQPKDYLNLGDVCEVWGEYDHSTEATLARLGFRVYRGYYSDHELYNWVGQGRTALDLPDFVWKNADQLELSSTKTYTVEVKSFETSEIYPALRLVGAHNVELEGFWNTPQLYVKYEQLENIFEWQDYMMFRIVRTGWKTAQLQVAEWRPLPIGQ